MVSYRLVRLGTCGQTLTPSLPASQLLSTAVFAALTPSPSLLSPYPSPPPSHPPPYCPYAPLLSAVHTHTALFSAATAVATLDLGSWLWLGLNFPEPPT